jgi:hypothetical protein
VDAGPLDWAWHVDEVVVTAATRDEAVAATDQVVGRLAGQPLPRDRPMWRIVMVRAPQADRSLMVLLVHHCVADGIGTVAQALNLFRPRIDVAPDARPSVGPVRRAAATAAGLAQLARDGRPATTVTVAAGRTQFCCSWLPLQRVRDVAHRHDARVTDLLLCLVVTALQQQSPAFADSLGGRLRVAVPLIVRQPGSAAEGNATAAVIVDLPVGVDDPADLLAQVRRRTGPLHTPTRALASRFVMARVLELVPEPALGWFARTVYGPRFLQAIVSNMPGPRERLSMAGVPIEDVVPVIPLAPGTALAVGALSWGDQLGIGLVTAGDDLDARALSQGMRRVLDDLAAPPPRSDVVALPSHVVVLPVDDALAPAERLRPDDVARSRREMPVSPGQPALEPKPSARNILARDSGESSSSPKIDRSWPSR